MKKQILIESVNANLSEREFNQIMESLRSNNAKIASQAVLKQLTEQYIQQQVAPLFRFEGQFQTTREAQQLYIANKIQCIAPQIQELFKSYVTSHDHDLQEYVASNKYLEYIGIQLVSSDIYCK